MENYEIEEMSIRINFKVGHAQYNKCIIFKDKFDLMLDESGFIYKVMGTDYINNYEIYFGSNADLDKTDTRCNEDGRSIWIVSPEREEIDFSKFSVYIFKKGVNPLFNFIYSTCECEDNNLKLNYINHACKIN